LLRQQKITMKDSLATDGRHKGFTGATQSPRLLNTTYWKPLICCTVYSIISVHFWFQLFCYRGRECRYIWRQECWETRKCV